MNKKDLYLYIFIPYLFLVCYLFIIEFGLLYKNLKRKVDICEKKIKILRDFRPLLDEC